MARRERRSSVNRYAHFGEPEETLDFHDRGILSSSEIHRMTSSFLEAARKQGLVRLRIVTGKGLHSKKGPVVRPQVERTLTRAQRDGLVASWQTAKVNEGGAGALDVTLST